MLLLSDFGTSANYPVNRPGGYSREVLILLLSIGSALNTYPESRDFGRPPLIFYMKIALPRLPGFARSCGVSTSSSL